MIDKSMFLQVVGILSTSLVVLFLLLKTYDLFTDDIARKVLRSIDMRNEHARRMRAAQHQQKEAA